MELPLDIGGEDVTTGDTAEAVMPHRMSHVLADVHQGGAKEVERAIEAAGEAWQDWSRMPWESAQPCSSVRCRAAGRPWRSTLNAATMLGQSKTAHQAEIDAACEAIDFYQRRVHAAHLRRAAELVAGHLEPHGVPAPRRVRLRGHALQLHGDRSQLPASAER